MADLADPQRLADVASWVRRFLESVWPQWHRARGEAADGGPRGTCGRSSLFLARVLREDFGCRAEWKSGAPSPGLPDAGFRSDRGWTGHAWVEAEGWIVDVTADQFGAAAVIVAPSGGPLHVATEDAALPQFRRLREVAVAEAWPLWQRSVMRAVALRDAVPAAGTQGG